MVARGSSEHGELNIMRDFVYSLHLERLTLWTYMPSFRRLQEVFLTEWMFED